jgi:predicted dehydrogenase
MAMSAAQARRMVAAADEAKRKLAIHFNHRMAPNVQAMRRYVEAGQIGPIYFARTVWHRRRGIPATPGFVQKANAGGGAMIDLGVHILDIALSLMDYPQPVAVSAQAVNHFGDTDAPGMKMDVDDFASAYIRFDDAAVLALEVSWACHHEHPEQMLTAVYGDKAGLSRCVEHYTNPVIRLHKREHGTLVTTRIDQFPDDCPSVHDDFVEAILADREPLCSARHGLITMQIIDAIYKSAATGREVKIQTQDTTKPAKA